MPKSCSMRAPTVSSNENAIACVVELKDTLFVDWPCLSFIKFLNVVSFELT